LTPTKQHTSAQCCCCCCCCCTWLQQAMQHTLVH
jgi:hypothetical protein